MHGTVYHRLSRYRRHCRLLSVIEDVLVRNILLVTLILVLLVFCLPNMSTLSVIMLRVLEVY